MAIFNLSPAPAWTPIGTGPLLISVKQAPIEIFNGGAPGSVDIGIGFTPGENQRVPLMGTVYARPLGGAQSALVISFTASS